MNRIYSHPKNSRDSLKLCLFIKTKICRVSLHIAFLILLFLLTGCSSGNSLVPRDSTQPDFTNSVPIIAPTQFADGFSATGMLGAYELTIDENAISGELVPMRTPSLGQSYIVNGASFFTITPCATCLKIKALAFDYPYIRADFLITHPFEKGDPSKPPSAKNRLDLDIFDPILIVVPEDEPPTEPHLIDVEIYSESCGYADGYTRELADVIDNEWACPYFLVVDDSDTKISTWNRFEMGTENHEFSAWFTGGRFELFLTFGYGLSTRTYLDRLNPIYFNPEFNRKAPWKVNVIPPAHGWSPDNRTETRDVIVEVYDWQIDATVDPNLDNPSDVYAASDIVGVGIEITYMFNELKISTTPDGTHTGKPDDPLIYIIPIANENLLQGGYYPGYVKVLDRRVPPQSPIYGQTDSIIDVPDGVTLNFTSMPEFATYQVFTAEVWSNDPPIADLDVSDYFIESGRSIQMFPGPATDDPDGSIIKYEYDFDYYPGWFDVDASNTNGAPVTSPPFYNTTSDQITHKVAMRVIDDGDPQKSAIGAETITIYPASYNRWVKTWGIALAENIEMDGLGNIYVAGRFHDTVNFNPGTGEEYRKTANGEWDMFLSKFDLNGDFIWARTWGGSERFQHEEVLCGKCDSENNIILTGIFEGRADFDPGSGECIFEAVNGWDTFLMKFSSKGEFLWARTWDACLEVTVEYPIYSLIECDSNDNIIVTGAFKGTMDFDPSDGTAIKTSVCKGDCDDVYFSKFNPLGAFLWVKTLGNENGSAALLSMCSDESHNLFITGGFSGLLDFDPDDEKELFRSALYIWDAFIAKYSTDIEPTWIVQFCSTEGSSGVSATVKNDVLYVVSSLKGDADLDPGPNVDFNPPKCCDTISDDDDYAISRFDTEGNYKWGYRIGCAEARGCAVDSKGDVYITGCFDDRVDETDFDPGIGTDIYTLELEAYENIFISKFAYDGTYLGTGTFSGGRNVPRGISISNEDIVYLAGYYNGLIDFDLSSYGEDIRYTGYYSPWAFLFRMF